MKNSFFSAVEVHNEVTILVVCRLLCANVVGATSSDGFLVLHRFACKHDYSKNYG